jgi:hypothetical protein
MQRQLRRPLLLAVAALAGIVADGCGGSANTAGGGGGGGGGGFGTNAGAYFVSGRANRSTTNNTIQFFGQSAGLGSPADGYDLVAADSSGNASPVIAAGGSWLNLATVSEWTAASGTATAWATRFRVYAGTDSLLHVVDLGAPSGSSVAKVAATQLSTASTSIICPAESPYVVDDYALASRSWVVFRINGPDDNCGTPDDRFEAIRLNAAPTDAPTALTQSSTSVSGGTDFVQPVETLRDGTGKVTGVLELVHPPVSNTNGLIVPLAPPTLQLADANLANPKRIGSQIAGLGLSAGGSGDFRSLGVARGSNVWLYADTTVIMAIVNPAGLPTSSVTVYTPLQGDVLQQSVVFDPDGTTAYLAFSNLTTGSYIVKVDTTVASPAGVQIVADATTTSAINVIGATSTNVIYAMADGSALKAAPKSGTSSTAPTVIAALASPLALSGTWQVAIVGDTVYYTVDGTSTPLSQAYSAAAGTSSITSTAIGSGSAVLGAALASPVSTVAPAANASAIIATGLQATSGTLLEGATISGYGSTGASAVTYGSLAAVANGYDSSTTLSDGPLQTGLPAFIELSGNSNGTTAFDLEFLTLGTAGVKKLTNNIQ